MDGHYRLAYQLIAQTFKAWLNCKERNDRNNMKHHAKMIDRIVADVFPHGSGLDGEYIKLDYDRSKPNRLIFGPLDFHHMDENGYYDGWTEHELIVTPDLATGYHLNITGRDKRDIKEYLYQTMDAAVNVKFDYSISLGEFISYTQIEYAIGAFARSFRCTQEFCTEFLTGNARKCPAHASVKDHASL